MVNTIRFLERRAYRIAYLRVSSTYPCFNGEMAQMYAEQAWDDFMLNADYIWFLPAIYFVMVKQAIKESY